MPWQEFSNFPPFAIFNQSSQHFFCCLFLSRFAVWFAHPHQSLSNTHTDNMCSFNSHIVCYALHVTYMSSVFLFCFVFFSKLQMSLRILCVWLLLPWWHYYSSWFSDCQESLPLFLSYAPDSLLIPLLHLPHSRYLRVQLAVPLKGSGPYVSLNPLNNLAQQPFL